MTERNWLWAVGVMGSLVTLVSAAGCQLSVGESEDEDGGASSEDSATGGRNPTDGTSSAATGGTSSAATGGTSSAATGGTSSAVSSGPHIEVCGAEEAINNGDRANAQPFGASASFCLDGSGDHDWFYVDAPDDGRAHVLQLDFTPDPDAWITSSIYADEDFSEIGSFTIDQGTKTSVWVTVGPGTRTLFDIYEYVSSTGLTGVKATLTPEKDPYESNNERDAAAAITTGTAVRAQLMVPYTADNQRSSDDWYKVDLTAGAHVLKLDEVPQDVWLEIEITDSSRVNVDSGRPPNEGATFDYEFEVETDGTYYFRLSNSVSRLPAVATGNAPSFIIDEYVFRID